MKEKNFLSKIACTVLLTVCAQTIVANSLPAQDEVKSNANRVAAWQMNNFTYSTSNQQDNGIASWAHSVLYVGFAEWAKISESTTHYNWLIDKANIANWRPHRIWENNNSYKLFHADDYCSGQFFVEMYRKFGDASMLNPTVARLDEVLPLTRNTSMSASNKQVWSWCDAIFMAPPVYAMVAAETGDSKYLTFMHTEFQRTYNHLYDKDAKLFFRDASYFNQKEANGEKVFWGRGNGWAIAGIANILKNLPEDYEHRQYYEDIFKEFALSLIERQDMVNGGWHASLLDPVSYPHVETSATGLITYALLYGLNSGLLTESEALPTILKAWNKMCAAIQSSGRLGWVQPIGQDPKTINANMTATFGVGAYLLSAAELYRFIERQSTGIKELSTNDFDNPETKITIYNSIGIEIATETLNNRSMCEVLNTKNFPKGVYIVRYQLGEKSKIIKYCK